jgi:hypothetical protein
VDRDRERAFAVLTSMIGEQGARERAWPKGANALSGKLRRVAPPLRRIGIHIAFERQPHVGTRLIHITVTRQPEDRGKRPSPASLSSPAGGKLNDINGGASDCGDGDVTMVGPDTVTANRLIPQADDDGDGGDAEIGRFSENAGIPDLCLLCPSDDSLDIPYDLQRCQHCGKPGAMRWNVNGRAVFLHEGCSHAWADRQERTTHSDGNERNRPPTEPRCADA